MEAEWHNKVADNHAKTHQFNTPKIDYYTNDSLAPILALPDKSLILEVGCGTGESGAKLLQQHYVVETRYLVWDATQSIRKSTSS